MDDATYQVVDETIQLDVDGEMDDADYVDEKANRKAGKRKINAQIPTRKKVAKESPAIEVESRNDRLVRLVATLIKYGQVGEDELENQSRLIKVMDKLERMDLTIRELGDSKAALTVSNLRKHGNAKVSTRAKVLRILWKSQVTLSPTIT